MTPTRGGKREGAGRKPLAYPDYDPTVQLRVRITQSDREYLDTIDPQPSKAIRQLIKQAREG